MWQLASIIVLLASSCLLKCNLAATCGKSMHERAVGTGLTAHGSKPAVWLPRGYLQTKGDREWERVTI